MRLEPGCLQDNQPALVLINRVMSGQLARVSVPGSPYRQCGTLSWGWDEGPGDLHLGQSASGVPGPCAVNGQETDACYFLPPTCSSPTVAQQDLCHQVKGIT